MDTKQKKNKIIGAVIGGAILGVICFYGGMKYGANNVQAAQSAFRGGMGAGMRGGRSTGGGFTNGIVLSKDANSITVKLQNGGSKIVFISDATKVSKSADGVLGDITIGAQVVVSGTPDSDGSLTAQSVQIRPAMPASTLGAK